MLVGLAAWLSAVALADPRVDYLLHCSGCHLPDGAGAPPEVPTLRGSLGRIVATPEGRDYIARVPGSAQAPISDADLAEVLNWTLATFNSSTLPEDFEPLTPEEVGTSRSNILADPLSYRAELWSDDYFVSDHLPSIY